MTFDSTKTYIFNRKIEFYFISRIFTFYINKNNYFITSIITIICLSFHLKIFQQKKVSILFLQRMSIKKLTFGRYCKALRIFWFHSLVWVLVLLIIWGKKIRIRHFMLYSAKNCVFKPSLSKYRCSLPFTFEETNQNVNKIWVQAWSILR